jgi:hypothetical protein
LVDVGVTAVVHQTEGQEKTLPHFHFWHATGFCIVVSLVEVEVRAVELNYQLKLQENRSQSAGSMLRAQQRSTYAYIGVVFFNSI